VKRARSGKEKGKGFTMGRLRDKKRHKQGTALSPFCVRRGGEKGGGRGDRMNHGLRGERKEKGTLTNSYESSGRGEGKKGGKQGLLWAGEKGRKNSAWRAQVAEREEKSGVRAVLRRKRKGGGGGRPYLRVAQSEKRATQSANAPSSEKREKGGRRSS